MKVHVLRWSKFAEVTGRQRFQGVNNLCIMFDLFAKRQ